MRRDLRAYLWDVEQAAHDIEVFTHGKQLSDYSAFGSSRGTRGTGASASGAVRRSSLTRVRWGHWRTEFTENSPMKM
jgi:hypothetical protein